MVTGCAGGIRSAQQPVIKSADIIQGLQNYQLPAVLIEYHSAATGARHGMSKRQYRDFVISLYVNAIDARYEEFRHSVDAENRATAIGFDLALLGLTGVTAVAEADEVGPFAAAIASFTGARSSLDKNLFFSQSLPAMFAAMDEERALQLIKINKGMSQDELSYPLELAVGDLSAYQRAGSFSVAISKVVKQAVVNKAEAEDLLANPIPGCESDDDMSAIVKALRDAVMDPDPATQQARINKAAKELNIPDGFTLNDFMNAALERLDNDFCSKNERNTKVLDIIGKIR